MKVFIITEGGRNIGFGHITRCISLYQAFEERSIIPVFVVNGDDTVKDLLKDKHYNIFNWLGEKNKLFELVKDVDIGIIDSYLADISFYASLSKLVKISIYVDDTKRLDYPRGIVVNGNIYAEDLDYPEKNGVEYLIGTKYSPLRKAFWNISDKVIKKRVDSIMVTFGGNDKENMTPKVLQFLTKSYPNLIKNVIIGKAFENIDEIKRESDKKTNLVYYPDAENIRKTMLDSDVAISAGGQTLYELARMGVPTIGICTTENQLRNTKKWEKTRFLESIGWYNENSFMEKLGNLLRFLESVKVRKSRSEVGRDFIDGEGGSRIIEFLLSKWFKNEFFLRKATIDDALNIFNLSNDKIVRENSFNPEEIKWDCHLKWLKEKIENEDCVFFVIVDNFNQFYGQVRFDIDLENKEAIINISLEKKIRSLGLASFIINKSLSELVKLKNVKLIKAYIKDGNASSSKSFEKAEFIFSEDSIIKENKTKLYIKRL